MKEDKFYVGAKVLRVSPDGLITKRGKIYEVHGIVKCQCNSRPVLLDLGFIIPIGKSLQCNHCKKIIGRVGQPDYCSSVHFRLIEPDTELSDIEVNELLDAMSEDVPNVNHNNHSL